MLRAWCCCACGSAGRSCAPPARRVGGGWLARTAVCPAALGVCCPAPADGSGWPGSAPHTAPPLAAAPLTTPHLSLSPQKRVFAVERGASDDFRTDPALLRKCSEDVNRLCGDAPKHGGEVQVRFSTDECWRA